MYEVSHLTARTCYDVQEINNPVVLARAQALFSIAAESNIRSAYECVRNTEA